MTKKTLNAKLMIRTQLQNYCDSFEKVVKSIGLEEVECVRILSLDKFPLSRFSGNFFRVFPVWLWGVTDCSNFQRNYRGILDTNLQEIIQIRQNYMDSVTLYYDEYNS